MSIPSRSELIERLTRELGYPSYGAELLADQIEQLQPELDEAFTYWWKSGKLPTLEIEGFTASRLIEEYGLAPLAALLTLDWLFGEPEAAKAAIYAGYDYIDTA